MPYLYRTRARGRRRGSSTRAQRRTGALMIQPWRSTTATPRSASCSSGVSEGTRRVTAGRPASSRGVTVGHPQSMGRPSRLLTRFGRVAVGCRASPRIQRPDCGADCNLRQSSLLVSLAVLTRGLLYHQTSPWHQSLHVFSAFKILN